jgi:hypothetical protein
MWRRLSFWKSLLRLPWGIAMLLLGLVGVYATAEGQLSPGASSRLYEYLPGWPWHVWAIALLVVALAALLESAFRHHQKDTAAHDAALRSLKADFDGRLAGLRATPDTTKPLISIRRDVYSGPYQADARIIVENESGIPIRCRAIGQLIDANVPLRNKGQQYPVKWLDNEGQDGENVTLLGRGDKAILEVVSLGTQPLFSLGRFRWPLGIGPSLFFFMSNGRRFSEAQQRPPFPASTAISVMLEIRLIAVSMLNSSMVCELPKRFRIAPGSSSSILGFHEVAPDD